MTKVEDRKELWITVLANFFLPGAGHVYAGDSSTGMWLMVGNIMSWALFAHLPVTAVGVLGTWIYALVTSGNVVVAHNDAAASAAASNRQKERTAAVAEAAEKIDIAEVLRQIQNGHKLLAADMINVDEFAAKKIDVITALTLKQLVGQPDDLLLALAPLKQAGVVSPEEVQQIKRAIMK